MIQFTGQYQLADFQAAQKLHRQRGRLATWSGYFLIGFFVLMLLLGAFLALIGDFPWSLLITPAIAVTVFVVVYLVVQPRQIARVFAQQKDLSAPFVAELGDEGFDFRNKYGNGRIPWSDFVKWKENKELLLLYRSDMVFNMLPQRIFAAQGGIEYAREMLRRHNVPVASQTTSSIYRVIIVLVLLAVALIVFLNSFMAR